MFKALLSGVALLCCAGTAQSQVMLSTYANKDGYIDVQKLTCGQLANTFQEDADYLTVWYRRSSRWFHCSRRSVLISMLARDPIEDPAAWLTKGKSTGAMNRRGQGSRIS
jgi:hypothetical protein